VIAFRVTGKVQGVSYRAFTQRVGSELGVSGWVKNEPDGAVTGVAEGDPAALGLFVARLRQGPPHARVDDVVVTPEAGEVREGFWIRR
jgi:acylphosphatase